MKQSDSGNHDQGGCQRRRLGHRVDCRGLQLELMQRRSCRDGVVAPAAQQQRQDS